MSQQDVIRAWKDEQYRASLSAEELAQLPENPAGQIELDDATLHKVMGASTFFWFTAGCCDTAVCDTSPANCGSAQCTGWGCSGNYHC